MDELKPEQAPDTEYRAIRWASALVMTGMAVLVATLWDVTPGSFVVFAVVAVPLVLIGLLLYGWTVFKELRRRKAL